MASQSPLLDDLLDPFLKAGSGNPVLHHCADLIFTQAIMDIVGKATTTLFGGSGSCHASLIERLPARWLLIEGAGDKKTKQSKRCQVEKYSRHG